MSKTKLKKNVSKYGLNAKGSFVIENYNQAKPFSNFFPGIAGLWGIPMWVFFVNRGQCIASFGIESKNKSIMEFQPANKSYRLTALQGFRTFIKAKRGSKTVYWEPFQANLNGNNFKKKQTMSMSAYDLTLKETNETLGLEIQVNYFTLPDESFSGLIRQVTIKNLKSTKCNIEMIDGLPIILPYGVNDGIIKNISRTIEAWVKVRNVENKAPYYHLNVEVSDTPEVTHIKEGNFFFSFDNDTKELFDPVVEASKVFGQSQDFVAPEEFINGHVNANGNQETSNRTPSAMASSSFVLAGKSTKKCVSVYGYAKEQSQLDDIIKRMTKGSYLQDKAKQNRQIIEEIKDFALTYSSSKAFNMYASHTFLDNILRGGLPVSLKTQEGNVAFNVYSRKHGDLERDYNYFTLAPTCFSQGNGNYRDVNQNRRNDIWFNADVKENHIVNFLNLSQADGYNPLVVKGTAFTIKDPKSINGFLNEVMDKEGAAKISEYLQGNFLPGDLLDYIVKEEIALSVDQREFLGRVLELCQKQELADHGEGFWSDHWTYNLDLIESYLGCYPENLKSLLIDDKIFNFYLNSHYVLPRDQRYVLTPKGVRQYEAVGVCEDADRIKQADNKLRVKDGEGEVYQVNLTTKLLCLIANKVASLDPSGIGVEMEADKPNWYDALNGLPGLLGSATSEALEIKRFSLFLLESLKQLSLKDGDTLPIYEELASYVTGLSNLLSLDEEGIAYWNKSNDIKEGYRQRVRYGIDGEEKEVSVSDIKNFLTLVIKKIDRAVELAQNSENNLSTYLYHEVTDYDILDKQASESEPFVRPKSFKRCDLPIFLEGYVHALRSETEKSQALEYYNQVRKSALYDKKLKMYKVNSSLLSESEDIGRARIFPSGWLENESIWLHMEYKFILELLRTELYDEFYENFKHVFVPFLKPETYGRSILENSSFIVSSSHEDEALHGQGYVARLSGSTAEFLHIWLYMNAGKHPFTLNAKKELVLNFDPALAGWLFTTSAGKCQYYSNQQEWITAQLPKNTYAFKFLGSTLVVYHNPKRKDTFGDKKPAIKEIQLTYPDKKKPVVIKSSVIDEPYASEVRDRQVQRIDVFFSS